MSPSYSSAVDGQGSDPNRGIPFRSRLEREVAAEMDAHLVEWGYEEPQQHDDGSPIYYLPDFVIHEAAAELELPTYVEAKPQQFIYDLRDTLGVTRQYGDRFSGSITVRDVTGQSLRERQIEELWKPKTLAEIKGAGVLVVGGVGGSSRLSVEMRRDCIIFRRDHPFVNWPAVEKAREREAHRLRYEQERRQYEQQREAERQAAEVTHQRNLSIIRGLPKYGANKFDSRCAGCAATVATGFGHLHRHADQHGRITWYPLCTPCEEGQ